MAILGTGTEDDPFIVDNWDDCLSCISNTTELIKWKEQPNKVFDFNDHPNSKDFYFLVDDDKGDRGMKKYCVIDFNGWTLKNGECKQDAFIRVAWGGAIWLKNGKIIDFISNTMTKFTSAADWQHTTDFIRQTNMVYSGTVNNASDLYIFYNAKTGYTTYGYVCTKNDGENISLNIASQGTIYLSKNMSNSVKNSHFKLKCITPSMNMYLSMDGFQECLFETETASSGTTCLNKDGSYGTPTHNVIVPKDGKGIINQTAKHEGLTILYTTKPNYNVSNVIEVNAEQLRNAEYLASKGFPIVTE